MKPPKSSKYLKISWSLTSPDTKDVGVLRSPYKNPLITNSYMGMNAMGRNSGLFCVVFPYRIPTGTSVFARVFNDISAEQATFYADTSVVVAPPKNRSDLVLNFGDAKPLDSGDDDNDGLINSWEQYLGISDRFTNDYDNDGISDLRKPFTNVGELVIADDYEENQRLEETNRMKHFRIIIPVD